MLKPPSIEPASFTLIPGATNVPVSVLYWL